MYPEHNQLDPDNPDCREESAYPLNPDSEYGWEKLFSERLYLHIIATMVSLLGLLTSQHFWSRRNLEGGREKLSQSAVKSLTSQRRVGLSRCGEMHRLVPSRSLTNAMFVSTTHGLRLHWTCKYWFWRDGNHQWTVETAARVAGKEVRKIHKLDAPLGVRGRNSNNDVVRRELGWDYSQTLEEGIRKTYEWISEQIN